MTCCHWFLPLLSLALAVTAAPAQGVIVYNNPYLSGSSVTYSSRVGKHGSLTLSAGTLGVPGYGYFGPPPRYHYSSSLSIYTMAPQVIVLPREPLYPPDDESVRNVPSRREGVRRALEPEADAPLPDKPLPGRDAGNFRPLEPDNRQRAEQPIPPEPRKKPVAPPDDKLLPLPLPPPPEANPVAESTRLVGLGKAAFADQQYGLAAERFLQAAQLTPKEALPLFLRAQALLALDKYLDAIDAINDGLTLQPDWPTKRFQPLELYGQHVAAYPEHLRRLADTLAKHPNDAALLFLSAYQLWFDGRKDEARTLFQRARPGVPDPALVDRFLQAKPAVPVASGEMPRHWL